MNKITGGAAFPDPGRAQALGMEETGMTLRDYFAAKAMQAISSRAVPPSSGDTFAHIAELAYATADAMLAARSAP